MEKGHLDGWPFSYILRLEDMQAAVNKAYIKNNIVRMTTGQQTGNYIDDSPFM
jgi:hypothetical protein